MKNRSNLQRSSRPGWRVQLSRPLVVLLSIIFGTGVCVVVVTYILDKQFIPQAPVYIPHHQEELPPIAEGPAPVDKENSDNTVGELLEVLGRDVDGVTDDEESNHPLPPLRALPPNEPKVIIPQMNIRKDSVDSEEILPLPTKGKKAATPRPRGPKSTPHPKATPAPPPKAEPPKATPRQFRYSGQGIMV